MTEWQLEGERKSLGRHTDRRRTRWGDKGIFERMGRNTQTADGWGMEDGDGERSVEPELHPTQ